MNYLDSRFSSRAYLSALFIGLLIGCAGLYPAKAADEGSPEIHIARATGPIEVDGDLSDAGWKDAHRVETFFETNPADNVPASVRSVAWLAYDDRYLYAAFEFDDPDPKSIRAPLGQHDETPGYTDYAGIIVDAKHDGKTAVLLLVNPSNVQYDALTNDSTGNEDSSYDLYWDSATRVTDKGWTLEMRIPFSSLRYDTKADPQTWGILLYRNRPRNFRTQYFSAKLPRGSNCFICHSNPLTGLSGLPKGGHVVLAPYVTGRSEQLPKGGPGTDTPLGSSRATGDLGLDVKWTPNANSVLDATINPDFSQVESDVAQISTNQRFALFYPEKRPFFLEGLDLFATPIQAVYTRAVTSPRWGARATGLAAGTSYTFLVAEDRGGGSVIVPGPQASSFANQDFSSRVAIGRARHDFGRSFGSFLVTDREVDGGAHNRVFGPDFQWRPTDTDSLTGQALYSDTVNPDRPDLSPSWTGQQLRSHAIDLSWSHSLRTWNSNVEIKDIGDGFRADDGFLPQVGIRDLTGNVGYNFYPEHSPWNRINPYVGIHYTADHDGNVLVRRVQPGISANGFWSSYAELDWNHDQIRLGDRLFNRDQLLYNFNMTPSSWLSFIGGNGFLGKELDFDNGRLGDGGSLSSRIIVRPTQNMSLDLIENYAWLDVDAGARSGRLFTAEVARLRASYNFSARAFLRLIGQDVKVSRDPSLYLSPVTAHDQARSLSALFGYRLNWQTVLFIGYDDERAIVGSGQLTPQSRTLFAKASYAFQR
jgi:hypothetical protein